MGKGFQWAYDLNGHPNPIIKKVVVPNATAIESGEPVSFTQGTGIVVLAGPTDLDDPVYGISMTEKAANDGQLTIEVSVSPSAVYRHRSALAFTATGGSTTTFVDSSLLPQVDNFWKGGAIKVISCAANPEINGKVYKISASTGSTGTLTLAETLPSALASGDTAYLCLGEYAIDYLGYDLSSDAMKVNFDANGGNVLRYLGSEPELMTMFFKFEQNPIVS
jgi:hypothetical protein